MGPSSSIIGCEMALRRSSDSMRIVIFFFLDPACEDFSEREVWRDSVERPDGASVTLEMRSSDGAVVVFAGSAGRHATV